MSSLTLIIEDPFVLVTLKMLLLAMRRKELGSLRQGFSAGLLGASDGLFCDFVPYFLVSTEHGGALASQSANGLGPQAMNVRGMPLPHLSPPTILVSCS